MSKKDKIKILKARVAAWKAKHPCPGPNVDAYYIGIWCADYDEMTLKLADKLGLDLETAFQHC